MFDGTLDTTIHWIKSVSPTVEMEKSTNFSQRLRNAEMQLLETIHGVFLVIHRRHKRLEPHGIAGEVVDGQDVVVAQSTGQTLH